MADRVPRLLVVLLPLLFALGGPRALEGATITLTTGSAHGVDVGFGGSLISVCSDHASTSDVGTGASLTSPCSGGMTLSGGATSYGGVSSATGSFSSTLSLGSSASYTVQGDPLGDFLGGSYAAGGSASATFEDLITLSGGTSGDPALLHLAFTVEGTISCGSLLGGPGECFSFPSAQAILVAAIVGAQHDSITLFDGTNGVTLDVPFVFGQAGTLRIGLSTAGQGEMGIGDQQTFVADFLNTATLTSAQVLDASGAHVEGAQIVSGSGLSYPSDTAAVPEPTSLVLLGTGLAGLCARRWRRGNREE